MTEKPDYFKNQILLKLSMAENIMKVFYSYIIQKKKTVILNSREEKKLYTKVKDAAIKKTELLYNFEKCMQQKKKVIYLTVILEIFSLGS